MKITKVSFEQLNLRLGSPYTIAYDTIDEVENFILKIETESRIVGFGCAAFDEMVTGENALSVFEKIKDIVLSFLPGKDALFITSILEELKVLLIGFPSVLAMVDMALHDIISRKFEVPLYQMLGGFRTSIPTSITIGILPLDETIELADKYLKEGFFILKIKGGLDVMEDIDKMCALKERFSNVVLRFDGNQGYTQMESIFFSERTSHLNIEMLEQPTSAKNEDQLAQVKQKVDVPIMADESIKSPKDALTLVSNNVVDMINIKIMKMGGIREACFIDAIADTANLPVMVGCMDECELGIAAGLHFSLARANVKYADLDGHFDIVADPFKGMIHCKDGVLYPSTSPGLGQINQF